MTKPDYGDAERPLLFWPLADLNFGLLLPALMSAIGKTGHSVWSTVRFTLRTGH